MILRPFRWPFILLRLAAATLKSRRNLLLENLALRHQLLVQPPERGKIIAFAEVGGLHHRYERHAA